MRRSTAQGAPPLPFAACTSSFDLPSCAPPVLRKSIPSSPPPLPCSLSLLSPLCMSPPRPCALPPLHPRPSVAPPCPAEPQHAFRARGPPPSRPVLRRRHRHCLSHCRLPRLNSPSPHSPLQGNPPQVLLCRHRCTGVSASQRLSSLCSQGAVQYLGKAPSTAGTSRSGREAGAGADSQQVVASCVAPV